MSNEHLLTTFDQELLEGYPDTGDFVRLSLSPQFAGSIDQQPYEVLIACAYNLGRFISHVQFFGNKYQAKVTHLKRMLEANKARTIGRLEFKAKDTDRTKQAAAYQANPELYELEKELDLAEQKAKHYEKMPEVLREMVNIIKYELRRKEQEREKGRFNAPV